jgi:hypothetical protein
VSGGETVAAGRAFVRTSIRRALPAMLLGAVIASPVLFASPRAEESPADLRESLRQSTITAIQLEMDAYAEKLRAAEAGTGPEENRAKFRERIGALEVERDHLERMPAGEYPDPVTPVPDTASVFDEATAWGPMVPAERREAVVDVTGPYDAGSLLEVEGTSRSGPFFRLAGILGGDAAILKPGRRYRIAMYLVFRREYFAFIGDYYVYVASIRE